MTLASLLLPDGSSWELNEEVAIGRAPGNDLVLPSKSVSRRHAVISQDGSRWFVQDCGSFNGTVLNGGRLQPGVPLPLRHADRLEIGPIVLVFSAVAELADQERTESFDEVEPRFERALSPLQVRVVKLLCGPWIAGESLDRLPSNEEIAAELGTPGAAETVKAALRRAYAKAGLSHLPAHAKRRALCRVARQRGWI